MLRIQKLLPLIICLSIIAIVLPACRKYEEGPLLSIRSREKRVENAWKAQTVTRNGYDITLRYDFYHIDFKSGGGFSQKAKDSQTGIEAEDSRPKWALASNDLQIRLTYSNKLGKDSVYLFMDVKRIANDNLRLSYVLDGDSYTLNLVPR